MKSAISGRAFIAMMRPLLGIDQKNIVSLSITARHDDAARMVIECIGNDGADLSVSKITTSNEKPELRRFIVDVIEVKS